MQSNYNNIDQNTNSMDTNNSESTNINTNSSGIKLLQNKRFQSKKAKLIAGGLFVLFLVVALGAGYFLTQMGQDLRQQAAAGDYPGTCYPGSCPAGWEPANTGMCYPECGGSQVCCILSTSCSDYQAGSSSCPVHSNLATACPNWANKGTCTRWLNGQCHPVYGLVCSDGSWGVPCTAGDAGCQYCSVCGNYERCPEVTPTPSTYNSPTPTPPTYNSPTPTPPLVERTLSGRVFCQDIGDNPAAPRGTLYPISNFSLEESTWTPGGLGVTVSLPVGADGNFNTSLTTTAELFAVRLPLIGGERRLPDGTLSNGQPYSEMVGPVIEVFDYCRYVGNPIGYESCIVSARTNHVNFNFKYENCSPGVTITPTPTPQASPTPVQVYPQCLSIVMTEPDQTPIPNPEMADIGQLVRFSCMASDPTLVAWYEFRTAKRVPTSVSPIIENLASDPAGSNVSVLYEILPGEYVAQCRVCSINAQPGVCDTQWEPIIWPEQPVVPTAIPTSEPISCNPDGSVSMMMNSIGEGIEIAVQSLTPFTNVELRIVTSTNQTLVYRDPEVSGSYVWTWIISNVHPNQINDVYFFVNTDPSNPGYGGTCIGMI